MGLTSESMTIINTPKILTATKMLPRGGVNPLNLLAKMLSLCRGGGR